MTNITELAQSLKAAAEKASDGDWVKESGDGWEAACSANDQANGGFIIAHFEGPDAAENREFVQAANPANIIALVEALEKAQTINAAAEKLVRCKGRYHSEQNYRALAALFGVKTPDLPPLEHENVHYADAAEMEIAALRQRIAELESRAVKLPDLRQIVSGDRYVWSDGVYNYSQDVKVALAAAGIKVEAE
ncbi:ead/Ea22-like family protein [Klebsiella pneumoniae]|uniref:ead/Ea22-like family protein n=1 Tax=Klebsiella pneumoniae TaxID=573 RepID=UPI00237C046A|nr:ead/Ea22-like family protein [Klebsiella pneumoniae]MCP6615314.1 ead/Ea22-like family protein [Klebsiella pneumoniae]MDE1084446.1 ead/Ea22-like family protein [Klebsiella pneumoniae]MDE1089762.1 ead/Ea22-like family protein [Klebsiella pneumoniae]MDE1109000.1 ead/Ea22-like family protein [Klebsiella pneumoniae]HBX9005091.1 ead/Ea22-like family protein [Klebsiella pneumoniae]